MKKSTDKNRIVEVKSALKKAVSVPKDKMSYFFKTGSGEYAEGDVFIGVTVPVIRKIAKEFASLSLEEIQVILESKINEERLLALIILLKHYEKGSTDTKEEVYRFYLRNLQHVNNWNLVDASAHLIVGAHLHDKKKDLLLSLAKSKILWERRIAIIATLYFIRNKDLSWTFKIAKILLKDTHDLIHKAVGWMLREAGKKDDAQLVAFLDEHASNMPRTMLRYAIEKFPEQKRKAYLLK